MLLEHALDGVQARGVVDGVRREQLPHAGEGLFVHAEAALPAQVGHPAGYGGGVASRELEQLTLQVRRNEDVHGRRGRQHEGALGYVVGAVLMKSVSTRFSLLAQYSMPSGTPMRLA